MEIDIADIEIGKRSRKDLGNIRSLADSIQKIGLLHAVVLSGNKLVSGLRRIEAYKLLGRTTIPCSVAESLTEAVHVAIAEQDENACRKDFTTLEAVAMGRVIEDMERPEASKRKSEGQRTGGRGKKKLDGKIPPSLEQPLPTRDKVGKAIGMSGRTYHRAKAVAIAAEQDPETFGLIAEEMDRTGKVVTAFDKVQAMKSNGKREEPKERGVGVARANEAINCLIRIPKNDALRKRGFQIVTDWIKANS